MLPIASVSLPWRTQITELNFSGSSVAIGAMTRATMIGAIPRELRQVLDGVDEEERPDDDQAEGGQDLDVDDAETRHDALAVRRGRIDAVEAERREIVEVDARVVLEVALDVPAVDQRPAPTATTHFGQAGSSGRKAAAIAMQ